MKKITTAHVIFTYLIIIFSIGDANAQVQTGTNYYYNNFDGGDLGAGITQTGSNSAIQVSSASPLSGSHSLSSVVGAVEGSYQIAALPANKNLNTETFGYEWTMVYRNNGGNTDNSDIVSNNENAWKYWLFANSANSSRSGYYLTQNGSTLSVMLKNGNDIRSLISYNLANNTTYAIRVQRFLRQGSYVWQLFVDPYTSSTKEASTPRGGLNYEGNLYSTYNYSGLQLASTSNGRFQFDELKVYSMMLSISGANDPAYGVSNPLYPGLQNAIIYGLKIETRGYFDIYQMKIALAGNINGVVEGTMKLNKSLDAYFGNADDSFVSNLSYYNEAIQNFNISDKFYTLGQADGSLATAFYYFITVNVKSSPTSGATFSISGAPELNGSSSQANYANTGSVVNVGTPATNTGNIRDWIGATSTDWNTASNWSPNTVPGSNDLARIGVVNFTNQPQVSVNRSVGNISFGTAKIATLTLNGATLTVNANVDNKAGVTIAGTGTLEIKGSFISAPTSSIAIIGSVSNLSVNNLVLNSASGSLSYAANAGNTTIKKSLQTSGSNSVSFTLGSTATLTLEGANPFSLSGNQTVSLSNGTVVYNASNQQTVSTAFAYKNITFSGAGTKRVASGTLVISGNWNSSGGKVDLAQNNTTVSFIGSAQAINDTGSDNSNGISFGNISLSGGTKVLSATGKFSLAVGRYLTLAENTVLQTGNNLTLKASVAGSASVAAIPASSSIQGQVTVEKYIQGGNKNTWRTNRMLSSPVYDNSAEFRNAVSSDRKYSFTQFIDDMIITGKGTGFDINAGNVASAWTYNAGFKEITTINTSLEVGKGAFIFYRGDRTNVSAKVTAPFVDAESIVMTFKGTLNQQDVVVPLTTANLIGNPYAATIDWHAVTKSAGVVQAIRVWNPSNRQYSSYNGNYGVNQGTRYIGPGQAFFVQASTPGSTVTFTESAKVGNVTQTSPLYNVIMSAKNSNIADNIMVASNSIQVDEQPSLIRVKLIKENTENSDETLVVLKRNELATVAGYDVTRMAGEVVSLSSLSAEGKQMAINYMPHVSEVSSVKLGVGADNTGTYQMSFSLSQVPFGFEAKLKDNYLNTFTDLTATDVIYTFVIDKAIAASFGTNRFEIMLVPQTTLPVSISSFTGDKVNEGVLLKWKTSAEENNSHFEVRRAGDDHIFTTLAEVFANQSGTYSLLDKSPLRGNNYYKLVQVDKDGKLNEYLNLVAVNYDLNVNTSANILVYPTLVEANFTLKYNGSLIANRYLVKVADVSGKIVLSQNIDKAALSNGYNGVLSGIASGVYVAELIDLTNGNKLGAAKLIKK